MLQEILRQNNSKISVEQSTQPGISLSDHLNLNSTIEKLNSKHWDFVILQEGTVRALIPEAMKYQFGPSVVKFDSIIKQKGGTTILYESYPISKYPEKYCYPSFLISDRLAEKDYCSAELLNSDQEFEVIRKSFSELNNLINCKIAPVGTVFELCKKKYPELQLFESNDDTHPSKLGSYLIACVFFRALTNENASELNINFGLNPADTKIIRELVDL